MHSLEEKNHLSNELERTKKKVEEAVQNKVRKIVSHTCLPLYFQEL